MGCGRVVSARFMLLLPAVVCVLLVLAATDARPQQTNEASSDWSPEWHQPADWWKPKTDKDKWRAFEPMKETSTGEWWRGKLDDDLWDTKAHQVTPSTLEKVPSTESETVTTTKQVSENTGEKKVSNITREHEIRTETTSASGTTKTVESTFIHPFYKKGEVNSFVEPDPASFYSSSGEYYARNSWDSSYSQLHPRKEPVTSQNNKETVVAHENKESLVLHESKPSIHLENNGELVRIQNSGSDEHKILPVVDQPQGDQSQALNLVRNASQVIKEKDTSEPRQQHVYQKEINPTSSNKVIVNNNNNNNNNTLMKSKDNNEVLANIEASLGSLKGDNKPENKNLDVKEGVSTAGGPNAVYGKGESLSYPQAAAAAAAAVAVETTKKPDEMTTKKSSDEFVDWVDWDNSKFDYYEDDDDESNGSDKGIEESKKDSTVSNSNKIKSDIKIEDDNTEEEHNYDEYEDDDDEDDDDNDDGKNSDPYKIIKKNGMVTFSGKDNEKDEESNKGQASKQAQKELDFDTMGMQSDEAASHVDYSHYSKGVIYDSTNPDHKPSIKKDLTHPASLQEENTMSAQSNNQDPSLTENNELQSPLVKKSSSVTHVQLGHLNTESDVSTSPNPPPPGVASNKESNGDVASSTTPVANSGLLNLDVDSLVQQQAEDSSGFVLSFPLEFCRVDYECRAGRTCVLGVCKCYTPAMCAGHHKPICGSDGKQYDSHCELHRTACVNRVHIRADRRGKCFQKEIEEHEKSWLMEQERLLQEEQARQKAQSDQSIHMPAQQTLASQDLQKEPQSSGANILPQVKEEPAAVSTERTTTTDRVPEANRECTWKDMGKFKDDLLMFYCQKFVEPNCKEEVKIDREYLAMLVYSYYDKNFDYYLTADELNDKERDEHFNKNILLKCHLHDFIKYADNLVADGKLTVSEFTSAFEPPVPSIPPHAPVEVISTLASAGNGLELKCGIDAETIIWRRHGAQLSDDKRSHQLMVFDDGALFFSTVGLHHIGNYTCMDPHDETNAQIHRLTVQSLPVVEVSPVTQTHITGSDIELKCHAEGVPAPLITWKLGGEVLEYSPHITHYSGGGHIVIHNAQLDVDAGTYTCSVHNQAGTTEKSVSVSVLPSSAHSSSESPKDAGTFVVYHSKGISAYDPLNCLLRHEVSSDFGNFKFIPDALDGPLTLCHTEEDCHWGGAVNVGAEFVYISQPNQNRVVVMNAQDTMNPLQVIDTDRRPEKLWYVKHLDQVWVLCGNQEHGEGNKTIVVIRDASQHIQHRSVHTQPVGNHFDLVQDLFIAPANDLNHEFNFGYVSHMGQNGLFKINLEDMSYTKAIDLANYGCVPINIAFVPIGGHVIIQCVSVADQHTLQLTMDYLTDTITSATSYNGQPMTSPDSRHLVTVDMFTGKVIVTSISDEGVLEVTYDVTVSASISSAVFMISMTHQGYDLVLASAENDDIMVMNLLTGKIEKLKGSKYPETSASWKPSPIQRHIVTGNSLSNYLMTPSRSSLVIVDAKFKQVECEFTESLGSNVMVYIPGTYTS